MSWLPDISQLSLTILIPVIMAIGAAFLAIQSVMGLVTEAQTRRIVNKRLQFKERFETTSEAMIELRKARGLDRDGNLSMPLQWFNQLVVRSGLKFQPLKWFGIVCRGGTGCGACLLAFRRRSRACAWHCGGHLPAGAHYRPEDRGGRAYEEDVPAIARRIADRLPKP